MIENFDEYHGHIIVVITSNFRDSPHVAHYTVWIVESNNSHRAVLQGSAPGSFSSSEQAHNAGMTEAKEKLDSHLSANSS